MYQNKEFVHQFVKKFYHFIYPSTKWVLPIHNYLGTTLTPSYYPTGIIIPLTGTFL